MKVLLFLAKGFETMEASVFVDVMGWAKNDHGCDVSVVTCGMTKTVVSTFGVPVTVDVLLDEVNVDDYDALAVPGGFEEYGFYEEAYSDAAGEMIRKFNFKDLHLGGPVFDIKKLAWMNQHYIQQMNELEFVSYIRNEIFSEKYLKSIYPLMQERISKFEDFISKADFFFNGSLEYSEESLIPKNVSKQDLKKMFSALLEELDELYDWTSSKIEEILHKQLEKLAWKPRDYFMPIRIAVTGRKDSPPLTETMEVIGREMTRFRIKDAITRFLS